MILAMAAAGQDAATGDLVQHSGGDNHQPGGQFCVTIWVQQGHFSFAETDCNHFTSWTPIFNRFYQQRSSFATGSGFSMNF
ncbi:hypothetical protein KQI65_02050 [bacterium]|nr:hypothetical protein [bacterium]